MSRALDASRFEWCRFFSPRIYWVFRSVRALSLSLFLTCLFQKLVSPLLGLLCLYVLDAEALQSPGQLFPRERRENNIYVNVLCMHIPIHLFICLSIFSGSFPKCDSKSATYIVTPTGGLDVLKVATLANCANPSAKELYTISPKRKGVYFALKSTYCKV